MKLKRAAAVLREGAEEAASYHDTPREHRRRIRTHYPLEGVLREVRRQTRVVGCFPDAPSALMLVAAGLRHIAGSKWGTRKYIDVGLLKKLEANLEAAG